MKARVYGVLLALLSLLLMSGAAAATEQPVVIEVSSSADLLAAAQTTCQGSGKYEIVLQDDITLNENIVFSKNTTTLKGEGKTLKLNGSAMVQ